MEIKPIRTGADYDAALAELERLMAEGEDTPITGANFQFKIEVCNGHENRRIGWVFAMDPPIIRQTVTMLKARSIGLTTHRCRRVAQDWANR